MAASDWRQSDYYSLQVSLYEKFVVPWNNLCVFSNGVGRSGAFCGLLSLIEIIKMETAIDFFNKVKAMRTQRPGMVQTVVSILIQFLLQFLFHSRASI